MRDFKPAPEGQPTESIKTMLEYTHNMYKETKLYIVDLERRLLKARETLNYWADEEDVLKWQLAQRGDEVNGL